MEIHGTAAAELRAARLLGRRVGVLEHRFVSIPDLKEARDIEGSRWLSGEEVPATYIPMKNAVFYSMAAAFAEERGSHRLVGGHNLDDRRAFEDTGEAFFSSLEKALLASSPRLRMNGLKIVRPLRDKSKAEVVALAARIRVPLELTWSCHRAGEAHCWRCDGCASRVKAFEGAGVEDPLRAGNG
ncbi:MAG: 7-cyano-7-deazaguanine synthase [Nitrososphaerota archaeon]|nr:7-cyano-7-deazaguanine synthase [Nitrososphaerota archaeon]MDG6978530.1 7-cyano-7-deazaguanine synthase [Nitrososphaerota archaeon]MDG7005663.1 7-cyano-7-deazaguanine synthase [Nitrososphaerota archaeon]MDG7021088.1 7-cyano-7-deazaguanine synthase [Nitrososphaerota archaeon]